MRRTKWFSRSINWHYRCYVMIEHRIHTTHYTGHAHVKTSHTNKAVTYTPQSHCDIEINPWISFGNLRTMHVWLWPDCIDWFMAHMAYGWDIGKTRNKFEKRKMCILSFHLIFPHQFDERWNGARAIVVGSWKIVEKSHTNILLLLNAQNENWHNKETLEIYTKTTRNVDNVQSIVARNSKRNSFRRFDGCWCLHGNVHTHELIPNVFGRCCRRRK